MINVNTLCTQTLRNMNFSAVLLPIIFLLTETELHAQWVHLPGLGTKTVLEIAESEGTLYAGTTLDGVYKSDNNMMTWEQMNQGLNSQPSKHVYEFLIKKDTIYAATMDGIYKSINNGESWTRKSNGIPVVSGSLYVDTKSVFEYNGTLFTGAFAGIYRSVDNAENWVATNITGSHIGCKEFIEHNGFLFAARESINTPDGYKSTDGGLNWEPLSSISVPVITFLSEPGKLWAGTIHGVWLSEDDGQTWESRLNGLPPDPYNSSIIRVEGNLVSSIKFGGSGIYRSFDDGLNWEDYGEGLPFLSSIEELQLYNNTILAATTDGLYARNLLSTGLRETPSGKEFAIYGNVPNPFHLSTTISFLVPEPEMVSIQIYDMKGELVCTLLNEIQQSGNKSVHWSATDRNGNLLEPGVYFCRITSGDKEATQKLLMVK